MSIVDAQVHSIATFLMRWKCRACGTTFRNYPDGVIAYKRYLMVAVFILCRRYLNEEQSSYRALANSAGPLKKQPIFYAEKIAQQESSERQKALEQPRTLSHVTIWRWMGFFALLWPLLRRRAERSINQAGKADLSPWRIATHKYASEKRHRTLLAAALTLSILSFEKYPTDFGTLYSGP